MNIGPVTPSSNTNSRPEIPTCGPASPTPGAATIVSTMSSKSARSDGPNSVTGLAGSRSTGSPSVRMRRITSVSLEMGYRCGSASTRSSRAEATLNGVMRMSARIVWRSGVRV